MIRCGTVLVLNYDDITEGLLSGIALDIPKGCERLMIKQDAMDRLNAELGYEDRQKEEIHEYVRNLYRPYR